MQATPPIPHFGGHPDPIDLNEVTQGYGFETCTFWTMEHGKLTKKSIRFLRLPTPNGEKKS